MKNSLFIFMKNTKKDYFKAVDLFSMSVESHIYFHIKEFFMLYKLAENGDISKEKEKSMMLETDRSM